MVKRKYLPLVCPYKLNETYDTLFELHHKLGITEEYLSSTTRDEIEGECLKEGLKKLLEESLKTRDNLITWYLKQTLVELNITISLLTARIKLIEYKLGLCDGLDLHQASSLALVNFCNILADMTVVHPKSPTDKKTMHQVSREADLPVWLSHYRNQICHVPSESPCISILVPVVAKSMAYMRESFWSKVMNRDTFDARRCRNVVSYIVKSTNAISVNQRIVLKDEKGLGKKQLKLMRIKLAKTSRACSISRKMLNQNPDSTMDILADQIVQCTPKDVSKNCALLLDQILLARCFELFVNKLISLAEVNSSPSNVWSWLQKVITLIGSKTKKNIEAMMKRLGLTPEPKLIKLTQIPSIKCCQIVYRLIKLEDIRSKKLIFKMRHRLVTLLGKERTLLMLKITKIAIKAK